MTPGERRIEEVQLRLGLDRMQAINHIRQRDALAERSRKTKR